jgi:hypothetical protein
MLHICHIVMTRSYCEFVLCISLTFLSLSYVECIIGKVEVEVEVIVVEVIVVEAVVEIEMEIDMVEIEVEEVPAVCDQSDHSMCPLSTLQELLSQPWKSWDMVWWWLP